MVFWSEITGRNYTDVRTMEIKKHYSLFGYRICHQSVPKKQEEKHP